MFVRSVSLCPRMRHSWTLFARELIVLLAKLFSARLVMIREAFANDQFKKTLAFDASFPLAKRRD